MGTTGSMQEGAFVMIDALGWKGISKRGGDSERNAAEILDSLQALKWAADHHIGHLNAFIARESASAAAPMNAISCSFLSDTIVIGVPRPAGLIPEIAPAVMAAATGDLVQRLLVLAAQLETPLTYRGCISYGKFTLRENFIIGPAVDEAGELHETADAALVWLAPSFGDTLATATERIFQRDGNLLEWDVPLKGGMGKFRTAVVPPVSPKMEAEERDRVVAGYRRAFARSAQVTVAIKRQNTMSMVDHATRLIESASRNPTPPSPTKASAVHRGLPAATRSLTSAPSRPRTRGSRGK
jgi:hypothetical protein